MMKKILIALFALLPLSAMAQHFGYLDYDYILKQMPEYEEAQRHLAELKTAYQAEMRHSEEEFNRKYNEFLNGQKTFAENIRVRRQKEIQGLYEAGLSFRKECEEHLKMAEEELLSDVKLSLNKAVGEVGNEMNLEYILNTSEHALLYAGPNGFDITEQVKAKLGIQ